MVVGAQAFSALIPLLIVLASLGSKDGSSFADSIVKRFDLSGDSAEAVHAAFAAPASGSTVTIIGMALVAFSALSFSRTLQRVFELTWNLPAAGCAGRWRACAGSAWSSSTSRCTRCWAASFHGLIGVVASLVGVFVLWLLTPYLLLDGRVPWRRLVPQAALCAVGMTILGVGFAIYVPRAMSSSAAGVRRHRRRLHAAEHAVGRWLRRRRRRGDRLAGLAPFILDG